MRRLPLAFATFFVALAVVLALAPGAQAEWVWPVKGEVITPYRNGTDPYATGQHRGIDIAASLGTPVVAAAGGDVRFAGTAGSSGLTISIRTGDGYDTSYLHLSALSVRAGAQVSPGDRIGAVGTTGTRSATAPHLHFGVRDAGTRHGYRDPLSFLTAPPMAPEPNPPATAPAPAPDPASPAPAPAPTGVASPRATPIPRSTPVPRGAPAPATSPPAPTSFPAPGHAGRRYPAAPPDQAPAGVPGAALRQAAAARRAPGKGTRRPSVPTEAHAGPRPFAEGLPAGDEPRLLAERRHRGPAPRAGSARGSAGPDIGWALACGGLLLAAAVLGLTGDNRRASAPTRTRLAELLRPLTRG